MIDIKSKQWFFNNCKKQPNYNIEGETKALYCSYHKKENMINVITKTCMFEKCKKNKL